MNSPSSPSQIQIGVWDGGSNLLFCLFTNISLIDSPQPGVSQWAGGPVPWASNPPLSASYESLTIQCYDNNDQAVSKWPLDAQNPDILPSQPNQPTSAPKPNSVNGIASSDGSSGSVQSIAIQPVAGLPSLPKLSSSSLGIGSSLILSVFCLLGPL